MQSLYKYLPEKYVESFVNKGEVLFRSLSYFRDYEDAQVRGDEFEGTRHYLPEKGLDITYVATEEKDKLPHAFESTVHEDDIFVFCLSTVLSRDLALQFQTDACVEITNPTLFISKIRSALLIRSWIRSKQLLHEEVKYYKPDEPPIIDWALPDKITISKPAQYNLQHEYRIAFAVNGAFDVYNTQTRLVVPDHRRINRSTSHPQHIFKLGSLAKYCKLHRFD